jgi:hypothetical protein
VSFQSLAEKCERVRVSLVVLKDYMLDSTQAIQKERNRLPPSLIPVVDDLVVLLNFLRIGIGFLEGLCRDIQVLAYEKIYKSGNG